nr:MAG TPA: hypothetical protein [Caudoviricetes sp.]
MKSQQEKKSTGERLKEDTTFRLLSMQLVSTRTMCDRSSLGATRQCLVEIKEP